MGMRLSVNRLDEVKTLFNAKSLEYVDKKMKRIGI